MKKFSVAIMFALLLSMPVSFAQSSEASANAVSVMDLRITQLGQGFSDISFEIRKAFSFSENGRIDLIEEKNEELKERQGYWLETKTKILSEIKSDSLESDQKKELIEIIRAEHQSIIKKHVELRKELAVIQANAMSESNEQVEAKAEAVAKLSEESDLKTGLDIENDIEISVSVNSNESDGKEVTEEEAKEIVEAKVGMKADEVRTEIKNENKFFVVSGEEIEESGDIATKKSFEVWVSAATGVITSVDLDVSVESSDRSSASTEVSVGTDTGSSGSAQATGDQTSTSIDTRVTESSVSSSSSANSSSSASASASASAKASA